VIEFERTERRLLAHGDGRSVGMVVHAVFVSGATTGAAKTASGESKQTPVRVASRDLIYDDVARRADFSGGVLVEDVSGTLRAQQAAVFLKPVDAAKGSATAAESTGAKASAKTTVAGQGAFMGGSVERMVASGGIEIVQPGRRVTGEQLVYTAADGMSVITGRSGVPPKMTDVAQGVITGASLRFHAGDNSVVVSDGPDGVAGQRVRTDTRVKQ
jgi:lipopolysaccharide export system protein LptA